MLAFLGIGSYNHLISLKNQVQNAWKQVDVQLKRRHDLIPNLINTVRGAMNFENERRADIPPWTSVLVISAEMQLR